MALLFTAGCLPAPLRVGATAIGKETSIRTKPSQVIVGASDRGPSAALGTNAGLPAVVAAPIISHNGGNVLQGAVRVPASIISHNGGNIISHNGGNIVSNNGGSIISHNGGNIVSNNGGGLRIAQVPLAFTTVRLKDAAGAPVKDAQGKDLTTKTDANGNYSFPVDVKGRNLIIEADVEGQTGTLKSLLPKEGLNAGGTLDVDLTSTLTLAYILEQYVKGDLATFERLPKDIEAKARTVTETAIVQKAIELPSSLEGGAIVSKVDEVRKADPAVDRVFEEIKAILIVAGITKEGDGRLATEVSPGVVGGLLADAQGNVYVFSQSLHTLWKITPDGILHTLVPSGAWGFTEQETGWLTPGYTSGMAFNKEGEIVLADTYNHRLLKIDKLNRVKILAGTGVAGAAGDGGLAISAQFNHPSGVAIAPDGSVFVSDSDNDRVRQIGSDGAITTFKYSGLKKPQGLLLRSDGILQVADSGNNLVRYLEEVGDSIVEAKPSLTVPSPIAFSLESTGSEICLTHQGSSIIRIQSGSLQDVTESVLMQFGGRTALSFPRAIANIDGGFVLTSGRPAILECRTGGDLKVAMGSLDSVGSANPSFKYAFRMLVTSGGDVIVGDLGAKRVYKVATGGNLVTLAGNGEDARPPVVSANAQLPIGLVSCLAVDGLGNLLVGSIGMCPSIRKISFEGVSNPFIGTGVPNFTRLPTGAALSAEIAEPRSIVVLPNGNTLYADTTFGRIFQVDALGQIAQFLSPDDIRAPFLMVYSAIRGLAVHDDFDGVIYLYKDNDLHKQWVLSDLMPRLGGGNIKAMCFDSYGNFYLANSSHVGRVDFATNEMNVIAGSGTANLNGSTKDEGLSSITDLTFSPEGDLYILEETQLKRISAMHIGPEALR